MEISQVVNTPLVFPGLVVGLVLICAVLVFVFGFKSVEDFPFDKLTTVADDRKPAGKKRKLKDKVRTLLIMIKLKINIKILLNRINIFLDLMIISRLILQLKPSNVLDAWVQYGIG